MLYGRDPRARWLRALLSTIDDAAAGWCRDHWHHGTLPALQPAYCTRARILTRRAGDRSRARWAPQRARAPERARAPRRAS